MRELKEKSDVVIAVSLGVFFYNMIMFGFFILLNEVT